MKQQKEGKSATPHPASFPPSQDAFGDLYLPVLSHLPFSFATVRVQLCYWGYTKVSTPCLRDSYLQAWPRELAISAWSPWGPPCSPLLQERSHCYCGKLTFGATTPIGRTLPPEPQLIQLDHCEQCPQTPGITFRCFRSLHLTLPAVGYQLLQDIALLGGQNRYMSIS